MSEVKVYETDEVAEILHITRRTLYNYIKAGQIKPIKVGRSWRFTEETLNDFLKRGTEEDYLEKLEAAKNKNKR